MKTKLFIFFPLVFLFSNSISGQISRNFIKVGIVLPKQIKTNGALKARITIKNISNKQIEVYKELTEGDLTNEIANLTIIVEVKKNHKFVEHSRGAFFDAVPIFDTADNAAKIQLAQGDSLSYYYHVDNVYQFDVGYYRIKCLYRNNIHSTLRFTSGWSYFNILKKIYVKHYFDENQSADTIHSK